MTKIDEFESMFNSASKPVFHVDSKRIENVLIVVDLPLDLIEEYAQRVRQFLNVLNSGKNSIELSFIAARKFSNVQTLLDIVKGRRADLVCTYRNLHGSAIDHPFSLGEYVDVLTQATSTPILLMPRPENVTQNAILDTDRVMVMTDHLAGDDRLVNFGALFTQDDGELTLAHVEDEQTFERYIKVIGKIPEIDTDLARTEIRQQLLKEPSDFILSCAEGLQAAGVPINVKPVVTFGHHLTDYRKLVADHETDLLVLNTKDEDQLAMHGLAYPVSVELRDLALLLI